MEMTPKQREAVINFSLKKSSTNSSLWSGTENPLEKVGRCEAGVGVNGAHVTVWLARCSSFIESFLGRFLLGKA